jgi:hypothetical protein
LKMDIKNKSKQLTQIPNNRAIKNKKLKLNITKKQN